MNSLYPKRRNNLAIITTIVLSSIMLASIYPLPSLLKPQSAFAQLSGEASIDVGNDTSTLTSPLPPSDQGSREESFEGNTNSPLIPNYGFPFAEDQQGLTLPSSPSASAMDFDMFMNSFANSIFNGSSIFGGLATSMVNGVKVSGIGLHNNGSRFSVTLSGIPSEVLGGNNTTNGNTTEMTIANSSNSVTVIAMRIPIKMADILSLAAASSSQGMDNSMMTGHGLQPRQHLFFR